MDDSRVPGIQYVAVDRSGVLIERHAGYADLAARRPMLANTPMLAFSMSKTITAVAVLQLVEQKALDLDGPIARLLPWQPYGPVVTIRQLLCHTAGIPNPLPLKWVHPAGDLAFDERARLDAVLRRHPRLNAVPGTRFAYSNIGYWLLGYIVEVASAKPFRQYVADHIAMRLRDSAPPFAYELPGDGSQGCGYLKRYSLVSLLKPWLIDNALIGNVAGRWIALRDLYPDGPAFGGVIGSASAFATLLQDQLREHSVLLRDETRALMRTPQNANNAPIPMTLGWHMGAHDGTPCLYKEGGGGGFHGMMRLYERAGLGTVVMTNDTSFNVAKYLDAVDGAVIGTA